MTPYPDTYCLIREERRGEETVIPLTDTEPLDVASIVARWADTAFWGELIPIGAGTTPAGLADYSATLYTDGRAPSAVCWTSTGFWLQPAEGGE